ncbi:MAG: dTDP-4-dehydrorhamnose 3,5-epimerase [Bacteroidia bacterium]|nr:dTDP-4-dehydrorhamnose 3,5-epimerase [Bacteroidia bacterium]
MGFSKSETHFDDLVILQPDVFGDSRGYFMELFNESHFKKVGLGHLSFVQDNLSYSSKGTLRGLHFQAPPHAQGKLITVLEGRVLDVAVDIRKGANTYGEVFVKEINGETKEMVYIPPGFAHGFQVLSDTCLFLYKCTNLYNKASEGGLAWDDPMLNIPWEDIPPILSEKDKHYPTINELKSPFELGEV